MRDSARTPAREPRGRAHKAFATFFATAVTGLVAALDAPAEDLWQAVAGAIPDTPDRHALLHDPLPAKPLTLMRLDPSTKAWAYLPNPLRQRIR